ncbi:restriction endonuclease subunit S [Mesorhizobium sp.]|uniref:restriction endonuclease subunit S n=1 Tax=Mesorhizobium sp. TaxID=1871066 RepID=UPI000FE6F598|nr:restriction endonuclease subunit S [Mesorhizobium sp.]RWD43433.1 MAG: restriction endonuclease subunit S [Mesorhizobium sp.]
MIDGLRPYPEMRPTGVPWLPETPRHWDVRRIKTLLTEVDNRSKAGEERLLSLRMRQGLVDHVAAGGRPIPPESLVGFKIVEAGQVVMNRMRAAAGLFGVADVRGLVSPDYAVFEPRPDAYNPYLLQAFRLPSLAALFRAESKGLGTGESGFLRLYTDRFGPIPVPYPPLDEQRLIERFLDWHGNRTAKLIRARLEVLKLVAEEREALTHNVVSSPGTRQMRLANIVDHIFRRVDRESTKTYTPVGLFNRGRGIFRKPPARGDDLGDSTFSWIEDGDLILSGQFAWEGAVALAGPDEAGCISSHRYHILRGKEGLAQTIYLSSFLRTSFGYLLLNEHSRGAAGRNRPLNIRTLLKEKIPVPPQSEQARLIELVTLEKRLADSIAKLADRLREFRTRLIADVVTGKLDVRAAAAGLPETSELAGSDDLAEADDLDEAADDAEDEEVAA